MKKRLIPLLLIFMMIISSITPVFALGNELMYAGRYKISETSYMLAPGITEYVTITNNEMGNDQNIDYFCEIDPNVSTAFMMAGFPDYNGENYKMQNIMEQAQAAQKSFDSRGNGYKVVSIINGDFFDMTTGEPSGAVVMEGNIYHPANGRYYFAILKDGTPVIRNTEDLSDVQSAVGGSSVLLDNGQIMIKDIPYDTSISRTAIGIKEDNTIVTMVCHGKNWPISCGFTNYEIAQMLKARGCKTALMLDGSGSSTHASMRPGDKEIVLRNSPSDGSARQVSSSLMFVTSAPADGIFHHAEISPINEVYTPGSEIDFSYVAVDGSTTPISSQNIPNLSWNIKEGCIGTIDSNGHYVADADTTKTGDVTIQLKDSSGKVCGESTITIQNPDSITFKSNEASIGFGDTSDLGLTVRYQGRDVHYKSGDLTWEINPIEFSCRKFSYEYKDSSGKVIKVYEPKTYNNIDHPEEMKFLKLGDIIDNKLYCTLEYTNNPVDNTEKRASAAKANIKISSVANNNIFGEIMVDAGKEPTSIMNFEDQVDSTGNTIAAKDFWTIGPKGTLDNPATTYLVTSNYKKGGTVSAELASRAEGYPVHSGSYSLKLNYSFNDPQYENGVSGTEGACFGFKDPMVIEGNPTALGVWVYVPEGTPNYWLRMQYKDGSGRTTQLDFTKQYKDAMSQDNNVGGVAPYSDGTWHYFEADLRGLQAPISIPAGMIGRLMVVPAEGNFCGKYLIDGTEVPVAEREGSIYFDDIVFIYGSNPNDTNSPEVTSFTINGQPATDNMVIETDTLNFLAYYKDGDTVQDMGIDYKNIFLYIDGNLTENATVDQGANYIRKDSVKLANGWHNIRLVVTDKGGNEKVLSYNININTLDSNKPTVNIIPDNNNVRLGQKFALNVVGKSVENIEKISCSILVDKVYKNNFTVIPANGYKFYNEIQPKFNDFKNTIEFELIKDNPILRMSRRAFSRMLSSVQDEKQLAKIEFNVPDDLMNGSSFKYGIEKGNIQYVPNYAQQNQNQVGGFYNPTIRLPIEVSYNISSDCFVANMKNTYFYIKNPDGTPAQDINLYQIDKNTNADTLLGTSDVEGKVKFEPTTSGTITVKASGSFLYTTTINDAPVELTQKPDMILHPAVGDIVTTRNITWVTNPLLDNINENNKAKVKYWTSETNELDAKFVDANSKLLEFVGDKKVVRVNQVKLENLVPGEKYFYQVGSGEYSNESQNWSEIRTFTMPGATKDSKILILGDIQNKDNTTANSILEKLKANGQTYDLLIQVGDLVDNGGRYDHWKAAYNQLQNAGDISRLYAVGNHEKDGDGKAINSHAFNNLDDTGYYSISYNNLYIAVIDYGIDYNKAVEWLKADAIKSNARWKILITHQPAYYTNEKGGNADMNRILPKAAEEAGIDIVFSGHDHSYVRTYPLKNNQKTEKPDDGIIYMISGALGDKGYTISQNVPFFNLFEKVSDQFNALYMDLNVTNSTINANTYNYNSNAIENEQITLFDTFSLKCNHSKLKYDIVNKTVNCVECNEIIQKHTGFVDVSDSIGKQVYMYMGNSKTGWFTVDDAFYHAGEDGVLHDVKQINTVKCNDHGYKGGYCNECQIEHRGTILNPTGHDWDANHICKTCQTVGKDISKLDIKLNSYEWSWNGKARRPIVTIKDGDKELKRATQIGSGIGEYYLTYPSDDQSEVGEVKLIIDGWLDYYGRVEIPYKIVPPRVENIRIKNINSNSVTLTWDPSHGATYYKISYFDKDKNGYFFNDNWKPNTNEFTIDGLIPGNEYQYRVRACTYINGEPYDAINSSNVVYVKPVSNQCQDGQHKFVETTIQATCLTEGRIQETCSICGLSKTKSTISALGHTVVIDEKVEPTCDTDGKTMGKHCSICNKIILEQELIPALGHKLDKVEKVDEFNHKGICIRCSSEIIEAHNWDKGNVLTQPTTENTGTIEYKCLNCNANRLETLQKLPIPSQGGFGGGSSTSEGNNPINVESIHNAKIELSKSDAQSGERISFKIVPKFGYSVESVIITDSKGNLIDFIDKGNGNYEFIMPNLKVNIDTKLSKIIDICDGGKNCSANKFDDVKSNDWYHDAVDYMLRHGMMNGTSKNKFSPDLSASRAMIVTILYRLEGEPKVNDHNFDDVNRNQYYSDAISWAVSNGIVNGLNKSKFGPDNSITREQLATMLYRYAEFKGFDTSKRANLESYNDKDKISTYAVDAMKWINEEGIIKGTTSVELSPFKNATRAQISTILMRFCNLYLK